MGELLPRPFEDLTLEDVRSVVAAVGEERESIYLERKASVDGAKLAKACAAFANTAGGMLVAGISDTDDRLVGMPGRSARRKCG